MALKDSLLASAASTRALEKAQAEGAMKFILSARDTTRVAWGRLLAYQAAIEVLSKARAYAQAIYQLSVTALTASDYEALDALNAVQSYRQAQCVERIAEYDSSIALLAGERAALEASLAPSNGGGVNGPGTTPPGGGLPDLGGAGPDPNPDDPAAPPADPATQVGLLAVGAAVVYAAWYFLIRKR